MEIYLWCIECASLSQKVTNCVLIFTWNIWTKLCILSNMRCAVVILIWNILTESCGGKKKEEFCGFKTHDLWAEYLGDGLKFVCSPDRIICGWLGSELQLAKIAFVIAWMTIVLSVNQQFIFADNVFEGRNPSWPWKTSTKHHKSLGLHPQESWKRSV